MIQTSLVWFRDGVRLADNPALHEALKQGGLLAATSNGRSIGPEVGFGFVMGQLLYEPVLVLKSRIGNRSLGWDLLPPGSMRYQAEFTERGGTKVSKVFAGYKDNPDSWPMDAVKGLATEPPPRLHRKAGKPIEWCAGKQYDYL